jgi:hypothetical protein
MTMSIWCYGQYSLKWNRFSTFIWVFFVVHVFHILLLLGEFFLYICPTCVLAWPNTAVENSVFMLAVRI